ncbi:MAG: DUF6325 family protein [Acidimicrobiales bacterium]|jgi:hypothetical protein|nr:DUF6325 family protein [Acidimicrobiales bacterium]
MSDTDAELGPIDYLVVEFPAGQQHFSGAVLDELTSLVEAELVRVLDLMVLTKDADGSVDVVEFEDLGDRDSLAALEGQLAEVLALEDVEHLAEAMEPGSTAGVLVWENTWAAPFAVVARESGGQLIASGRIPTQALIAAMSVAVEED